MPTAQQIVELLKLAAHAVLQEGEEFVPIMERLEAEHKKCTEMPAAKMRAKRLLEELGQGRGVSSSAPRSP